MIKVALNTYNYSKYSKYYYRINIDNEDFYIKMSGNYNRLQRCILYKNTHYRGPDIMCTGDHYSTWIGEYLIQFPNTIEEGQQECINSGCIFTLYTYQEIKNEKNIISDKLFDFFHFERYVKSKELNKDNFIELCFKDRHKNRTEKLYLKEEDFVQRISETEILVNIYCGRYLKTVYINKKGEEYIKTGKLGYDSNIVYLTENQKFKLS